MLKKFIRAGAGGAGSQAINLLALPIISRIYTPEVYAIWAIVMAIAGIFGSISCFRYELAIVIPKEEEEASAIFWLCVVSSIGMGLLLALIAQTAWLQIIIPLEPGGNKWFYSLLVPCLVLTMGLAFALQYWNVRQESYMLNSFAQTALALVTLMIQVVWAIIYSASPEGLILGSLAGLITTITVSLVFAQNLPKISKPIFEKIPKVLNEQRNFFFYSTPYILFAEAKARGSLFILEYFLTSREVGLYAFAYRILNFPVSLLSSALRPVLYQETASKGVKLLEEKITQILKYLATITIPFLVLYFFYAKWLFGSFFGEEWADSGTIGKFLILPVFTYLFCNWMDRIMDVMGKQRLLLVIESFFGTISIGGLCFGFIFNLGLSGALLIQCIVLILYNITYLYIAYDNAGYDKRKIGELFYQIIIWTSISAILLFLLGRLFPIVLAIPLYFSACIFIFLWFSKSRYRKLNRLLV